MFIICLVWYTFYYYHIIMALQRPDVWHAHKARCGKKLNDVCTGYEMANRKQRWYTLTEADQVPQMELDAISGRNGEKEGAVLQEDVMT